MKRKGDRANRESGREREGTLEKRVYRSGWSGTIGWHATTRFSWWLYSLSLSLSVFLYLSLPDILPASCAHRFSHAPPARSLFQPPPRPRRPRVALHRCRSETPSAWTSTCLFLAGRGESPSLSIFPLDVSLARYTGLFRILAHARHRRSCQCR